MADQSQQQVIDRLRDTLRQIAEFAEVLPISATVALAREVYEDTGPAGEASDG